MDLEDFNDIEKIQDIDLDELMDMMRKKYPEKVAQGNQMMINRLISNGFSPKELDDLEIDNTLAEAEKTTEEVIQIAKNHIEAFKGDWEKDWAIYATIINARRILKERGVNSPLIDDFFKEYPNTLRTLMSFMPGDIEDSLNL